MKRRILKSQIQVGVKEKESLSGIESVYEILMNNIQIDEKIQRIKMLIKEAIDKEGLEKKYVIFSCIAMGGVKSNHRQIIRLYAIKGEEETDWRVEVGCFTKICECDFSGNQRAGDSARNTG